MVRLCIADDEQVIREGLASLSWSSVGIRVVAKLGNGLDVIEALHEDVIDVILSDIRMPGASGIEVARHVAESSLNTGVVLLSGFSDFEYARSAIRHDVVSYLLKPSSPEEILAAVSEASETVRKKSAVDLRLRLLEAELGKRQLVVDDDDLVLGEVSHSGVAEDVIRYMVAHFRERITLKTMSDELSYSSIYLSRVIKRATGHTFLELINGLRVQEASYLLRTSELSFSAICARLGIGDARYFGQVFKRLYKLPPSRYRKEPCALPDHELACVLESLKKIANK